MKQILVISGKGGTGKTVVTGALASLAKNAVIADCDVDAADMHLLMAPEIQERHVFKSGVTAVIDKDRCVQCGKCRVLCRFDAISRDFVVDPISCEGCKFCGFACPAQAIDMQENICGEWYVSDTRFGPMVYAKLGIAEENSGKLVSIVRKKTKEIADDMNADWVIIDGSPGIGCPVIASFSGIDCALVVTEPTLSGLHDARRVVEVAKHFGVPVMLVINKYDLNNEITEQIETYCEQEHIPVLGKIGFDENVVRSVVVGKTIVECSQEGAAGDLKEIWEQVQKVCL